jgi:hypothetical protein
VVETQRDGWVPGARSGGGGGGSHRGGGGGGTGECVSGLVGAGDSRRRRRERPSKWLRRRSRRWSAPTSGERSVGGGRPNR